MLGLFGKKSDHPMADPKSAQELLQELPKNDALKALLEISAWVDSVRTDPDIRLDNRFAAVRLLDETGRHHEIKVLRDYFSRETPSEMVEKRLWKALNEYYAGLATAYRGVLAGCHNGEKGASSLKALRPLIAARGVNAVEGCLKFAAVRYAPVEQDLWQQLAEYYTEAETQKFLDEAIELYPGASAQYSIRHQVASVLLWWATGTGSLKPLQIHLSERLTAHLCRSFSMGPEPGENALFAFDLARYEPPVRYNGATAAHPNLRFIGVGGVKVQLEPLIEKLEQGTIPGEINLLGSYDVASVLEMAKRLAANWLAEPPSRRNVRRTVNVNLNVVQGFAGLIDRANGRATPPPAGGSVWVAEDISATGFRCTLDQAQGAGVKVGSLIGFMPENVAHWGAGIVRRLRRDERGKLDVGVEILTNRAARVKLGEEVGPAASGENFAVWLGQVVAEPGNSRVLVKPGNFAEGRALHMHLAGKQYMLMPQGVLEKGDDYDLMRYRLVEREGG